VLVGSTSHCCIRDHSHILAALAGHDVVPWVLLCYYQYLRSDVGLCALQTGACAVPCTLKVFGALSLLVWLCSAGQGVLTRLYWPSDAYVWSLLPVRDVHALPAAVVCLLRQPHAPLLPSLNASFPLQYQGTS
jgi:hypothetical protein